MSDCRDWERERLECVPDWRDRHEVTEGSVRLERQGQRDGSECVPNQRDRDRERD